MLAIVESKLFSKEEDFVFWKNMVLLGFFFIIAPLTLGVSLFSLFTLKSSAIANERINTNLNINSLSGARIYTSIPNEFPSISASVGLADARPEIIKQYLEYYNSPLVPYANLIVQAADENKIDFRLITAIAQQESNLCKVIPPGSYNCWGWGITSQGTLKFNSFADGIEQVSKGLRTEYLDKGYLTIPEIMSKYTPQSNGSWANGVTQFMAEMQ